MNRLLVLFALISGWLNLTGGGEMAGAARQATPGAGGVVRAVLFYSPTCPHCQYVAQNVLPPLLQQYGNRLQIASVNASQRKGLAIYQAAMKKYNLSGAGVPMLVVGDIVLIGSEDIPAMFPGLIEQFLAQGGVAWPDIPGLAAVLPTEAPTPRPSRTPHPTATIEPTPTITRIDLVARINTLTAAAPIAAATQPRAPTTTWTPLSTPSATPAASTSNVTAPPPAPSPTVALLIVIPDEKIGPWEQLLRDPIGNGLAAVVLAGMIVVTGWVVFSLLRPPAEWRCKICRWLVAPVCLAGLGVASYLAFVETAQVRAVCGPVGDCNAVQQSEYAHLFGVLPVGVLGVLGYLAMLAAWSAGLAGNQRLAALADLALFGMAFGGTLFSIYLTFLEPFVIGATCAWCLTSAVLTTFLLWLSAAPARQAMAQYVST